MNNKYSNTMLASQYIKGCKKLTKYYKELTKSLREILLTERDITERGASEEPDCLL